MTRSSSQNIIYSIIEIYVMEGTITYNLLIHKYCVLVYIVFVDIILTHITYNLVIVFLVFSGLVLHVVLVLSNYCFYKDKKLFLCQKAYFLHRTLIIQYFD